MVPDPPPQPRRFPSALDTGKLLAVGYDGDAGFFHRRLIQRRDSTAAIFNTDGETRDSSNGLFWILTPDGDVYSGLFLVPPLTGLVWLSERNVLILTTMRRLNALHLDEVLASRKLWLSETTWLSRCWTPGS